MTDVQAARAESSRSSSADVRLAMVTMGEQRGLGVDAFTNKGPKWVPA